MDPKLPSTQPDRLVEIAKLIFSPSGAIIVVSSIILILVLVVILFRDRFAGSKITLPGGAAFEAPGQQERKSSSAGGPENSAPSREPEFILGRDQAEPETRTGQDEVEESPELKIITAIQERDQTRIISIFNELATKGCVEVLDRPLAVAKAEALLLCGSDDQIAELRSLEVKNPDASFASQALFNHYFRQRLFIEAERQIEVLGKRDSVAGLRAQVQLREIREGAASALTFLKGQLDRWSGDELSSLLFLAATMSKTLDDHHSYHFFLAKSLSLRPQNDYDRFQLAYSFSERGEHIIGIYYYEDLIRRNRRHDHALNNLANSYIELGAEVSGVAALEEAAKYYSPYPQANLASRLVEKGFLSKARETLSEIPEQERFSNRAAEAARYLNEAEERDRKKRDLLSKASKRIGMAYEGAVSEWGDPDLPQASWLGTWNSASGHTLKITSTGGDLRFEVSSLGAIRFNGSASTSRVLLTFAARYPGSGTGLLTMGHELGTATAVRRRETIELIRRNDTDFEQFTFVRTSTDTG